MGDNNKIVIISMRLSSVLRTRYHFRVLPYLFWLIFYQILIRSCLHNPNHTANAGPGVPGPMTPDWLTKTTEAAK